MVWALTYSQVDELSSNHCSFHCMSESGCNGPEPHQMWLSRSLISNSYSNPLTRALRKVVERAVHIYDIYITSAGRGGRGDLLDVWVFCMFVHYIFTWARKDWSIVGPLTIYYCCHTSLQHHCQALNKKKLQINDPLIFVSHIVHKLSLNRVATVVRCQLSLLDFYFDTLSWNWRSVGHFFEVALFSTVCFQMCLNGPK